MFVAEQGFNASGWLLGASCPNCERFVPAFPHRIYSDCEDPSEVDWTWRMHCICGVQFLTKKTEIMPWASLSPDEIAQVFDSYSPLLCGRPD